MTKLIEVKFDDKHSAEQAIQIYIDDWLHAITPRWGLDVVNCPFQTIAVYDTAIVLPVEVDAVKFMRELNEVTAQFLARHGGIEDE